MWHLIVCALVAGGPAVAQVTSKEGGFSIRMPGQAVESTPRAGMNVVRSTIEAPGTTFDYTVIASPLDSTLAADKAELHQRLRTEFERKFKVLSEEKYPFGEHSARFYALSDDTSVSQALIVLASSRKRMYQVFLQRMVTGKSKEAPPPLQGSGYFGSFKLLP